MFKTFVKFLEKQMVESWWVILFALACYVYYEHGLSTKEQDFAKLNLQHAELKKEFSEASKVHNTLMLQVNSQSDPSYVELTLMEGLGLVPEGETKVLFTDIAK